MHNCMSYSASFHDHVTDHMTINLLAATFTSLILNHCVIKKSIYFSDIHITYTINIHAFDSAVKF